MGRREIVCNLTPENHAGTGMDPDTPARPYSLEYLLLGELHLWVLSLRIQSRAICAKDPCYVPEPSIHFCTRPGQHDKYRSKTVSHWDYVPRIFCRNQTR